MATGGRNWNGWHFAALLTGNAALALGPLWVRLADAGPVAAGFWRLLLAIPAFVVLARWNGQRLLGHSRAAVLAIMAGGGFVAGEVRDGGNIQAEDGGADPGAGRGGQAVGGDGRAEEVAVKCPPRAFS